MNGNRVTFRRILFIVLILTLTLEIFAFRSQLTYFYRFSRAALSYYGSTGQEVTNIQSRLKRWGYYAGAVDGIYGYETYKAVRYFQYKNGLVVDGVAGPETLSALGLPTGTTATSTGYTRSSDI